VWELIEIAGVIVMQVREDHLRNSRRIHIQEPQRLRRGPKQLAPTPRCCFLREPGIDEVVSITSPQHPNEVIQVRREFVRIGQSEVFAGMAVAQVGIPNCKDLERF